MRTEDYKICPHGYRYQTVSKLYDICAACEAKWREGYLRDLETPHHADSAKEIDEGLESRVKRLEEIAISLGEIMRQMKERP